MESANRTPHDIHLGEMVARARRRLGLTQEALAARVGVTKAAVSKWELGLSLPDVAMLPRIASQLGMSIDELVGYEPQLTDAELRALTDEVAPLAATDLHAAVNRCEDALRGHGACWSLLAVVAGLYTGWSAGAAAQDDAGLAQTLRERANDLCERIRAQSGDAGLIGQARLLQATLLGSEGRHEEAAALLEGLLPANSSGGVRLVLEGEYRALGQTERALELSQRHVLEAAAAIAGELFAQIDMRDDPAAVEAVARIADDTLTALGWARMTPQAMASLHLVTAQRLRDLGAHEAALGHAEQAARRLAADDGTAAAPTGSTALFDRLDLPERAVPSTVPAGPTPLANALAAFLADDGWDGFDPGRRTAIRGALAL